MKYNEGDKVRIKSLDWYNENKTIHGDVWFNNSVFVGGQSLYCGCELTIRLVTSDSYYVIENDYYWTDEMIECKVEKESKYGIASYSVKPKSNANCLTVERVDETKPKDMGEVSDGYHTFNELYEFRLLYNAALFNEFAKQGLYDVHKSRKHSNGEYPFGDSNWFIVMAELPTGQISNHYEIKDWDKFQIPEKPLANKWDEHSPRDVVDRLTNFITPKKYPNIYEECCKVLGILNVDLCFNADYRSFDASKEQWKRLGLINQFYQLLICRDAYWKIAGDEMGLGKPWEPDWSDDNEKYSIYTIKGILTKAISCYDNAIFAFPTEEMRDAFYEAFKELIEECKELL